MRFPLIAAFSCLVLASCDNRPKDEAVMAFEQYQDALFAGSRQQLRSVLSQTSRPVVAHVDFAAAAGKQRLEVVDASYHAPNVLLGVRDPNADGARHTYVVVREDGEMRVDLLGSTAYNQRQQRTDPSGPRFDPKSLGPHELEKIRSQSRPRFR